MTSTKRLHPELKLPVGYPVSGNTLMLLLTYKCNFHVIVYIT